MSTIVGTGRMALPAGAVIPSLGNIQSSMAAIANPGHPDPCNRLAGLPGLVGYLAIGPSGVSGLLEPILGPTRCGDHYIAIRANGNGTVTIGFEAGAIGVAFGTITSTWSARVNGISVLSDTQVSEGGLRGWGHGTVTGGIWVYDVPVEAGDLITVNFSLEGDLPAFFAIDDFAHGAPNSTWLYVNGDLAIRVNRRMRGSGAL